MSIRCLVVAAALAALSFAQGPAPKKKAAAAKAAVLRTAWGEPDLQGIWDFATITPLERSNAMAGKEVLSDSEAAEFEKTTLEQRNQDRRDGGAAADVGRAYNHFWWDFGTKVIGTKRTSLIVDPPDGRIPPMTPEGKARADALAATRRGPPAGPENRNLWERCLVAPNAGPPMIPSAYNNNVQIFQTRGTVVIYNEMINDARIVPLDGRPQIPENIRQWRGSSRGRWDGATLVVETANFRNDINFRGSTAGLRLVERFTRVDAGTLLYEFTVTDPATWTRPWSVALPMSKSDGPVYEYACHEGNYGMVNLLAGARAEEKAAAVTGKGSR